MIFMFPKMKIIIKIYSQRMKSMSRLEAIPVFLHELSTRVDDVDYCN